METLGYLLASITAVYLWTDKVKNQLFMYEDVHGRFFYRNNLCFFLDTHKIIGWLLGCGTCLSFWIGLILFFIFDYQIFYLSLPLFYKLIYKQL